MFIEIMFNAQHTKCWIVNRHFNYMFKVFPDDYADFERLGVYNTLYKYRNKFRIPYVRDKTCKDEIEQYNKFVEFIEAYMRTIPDQNNYYQITDEV